MVVTIKGKKYWLWRAVDANGYVLDALLQNLRNNVALHLMRKLLKSQGTAPRVMVTDKLRSYSAAKAELMPKVEHRPHKGTTEQKILILLCDDESGACCASSRRDNVSVLFQLTARSPISSFFITKTLPTQITANFAITPSQHGEKSRYPSAREIQEKIVPRLKQGNATV